MKVKMKIKHLFIGSTVLLVLFTAFVLFLHPKMEAWSISRQLANGEIEVGKERILEHIENDSKNKRLFIEKYFIEPELIGQYDIYISPSMSHWSHDDSTNRIFTRDESTPYLMEYVKEGPPDPRDENYMKAIQILLSYYGGKGNEEKVKQVFQEAFLQYKEKDYHYHELRLEEIKQSITFKQLNEAGALIASYENELTDQFSDTWLQLAMLEAELLLLKEEADEAIVVLEDAIKSYVVKHEEMVEERRKHDPEYEDEGLENYYYYNEIIQFHDDLIVSNVDERGTLSTIEGKVVKTNGEPLGNVGVYLRDESNMGRSISPNERYEAITAPDGSYRFEGVLPGSYQVAIGLLFEQVDGWAWTPGMDDWIDLEFAETASYDIELSPLIEVYSPVNDEVITEKEMTFDWEDYDGAETYTLLFTIELSNGGAFGVPIRSNIEQSQLTLSLEELYNKTVSVIFEKKDREISGAESLLAFANVEGTFSWYVHAYDSTEKRIAQSNRYRLKEETMGDLPSFKLQEREMTEADNLLMAGKIEEALAQYKKEVEENPEDIHSLRMITRMNGLDEDREVETIDFRKQLHEFHPSEENMYSIFSYYYDKENWEEAQRWYSIYKEELPDSESSHLDALYGVTLVGLGKLEEARSLFHETMDEQSSNRFVGYLLALELYFDSDLEDVLALAKKYKDRGYEAMNWEKKIRNVQHIDANVIHSALHLFFTGENEELDHFLRGQPNSLKQLIQALKDIN